MIIRTLRDFDKRSTRIIGIGIPSAEQPDPNTSQDHHVSPEWRPAARRASSLAAPPVAAYGAVLNRRSVMRGSIAAELSTFREKTGATRIPRTLSAGTPLDSMFPRYDVSWV